MRKFLSFLKWTAFGVMSLFGVLMIWLVLWLDIDYQPAPRSIGPTIDTERKQHIALTACQTTIKANLKNPRSAEFVDHLNWPATLENDIWTIRATYRGTNGFGGVVTETITCKSKVGSFSAILIR